MLGKALSCLLVCCAMYNHSFAAPKSYTRYVNFAVAGNSALDILRSLDQRGPSAGGISGYGVTHMVTEPNGSVIRTRAGCAIREVNYQFTIKLPYHKNSRALPGKTAAAWSKFFRFVKVHEEMHRTIYMRHIHTYLNGVANISEPNCKKAESVAARLWQNIRAQSDRQHASFDSSERSKLESLALVRMAMTSN